ncbi:MAG: hypothetical protein FWD64_04565 [Acidobacteriaceae bacterium]|nr:hypothetical protein [Acidobacteriaceae bacterium]
MKKLAGQIDPTRSPAKKLNPALKSWLDNVIIPALVSEYLNTLKAQNSLAIAGVSELTSNMDGKKS